MIQDNGVQSASVVQDRNDLGRVLASHKSDLGEPDISSHMQVIGFVQGMDAVVELGEVLAIDGNLLQYTKENVRLKDTNNGQKYECDQNT